MKNRRCMGGRGGGSPRSSAWEGVNRWPSSGSVREFVFLKPTRPTEMLSSKNKSKMKNTFSSID